MIFHRLMKTCLDSIFGFLGSGDSCQRRAIVAFSYDRVNEDELWLQVGDVIEVLGEEETGWWRGRLNGQIGVFPSDFVKIMDESTSETNGDDSWTEIGKVEEKGKYIYIVC